MKRNLLSSGIMTSLALILFLIVCLPTVMADEAKGEDVEVIEETLYVRLGGYGAISVVVNQFAEKLFVDPEIGPFFKGMGTDSRKSFIQKNINLVCNATGGPCEVISRSAKTAHDGLGITEENFTVCVGHLTDVLNQNNVPAKEQQELLAIIASLQPDIVQSGKANPSAK
jgi:hemoglobin